MSQHAIKNITIGKNSGKPLDPSDIEFSIYSYGRHVNEDGEVDQYSSFELVTHQYDKCEGYHILTQPISNPDDINVAKTFLLTKELIEVVTSIIENYDEDEYIELLHHAIDGWIQDGYEILTQHTNGEEKNE